MTRSPLRRVVRLVARGLLSVALLAVAWVLLYRIVNPPVTLLMLTEGWRVGEMRRDWRSLDAIAPSLALAAAAAEDARFCEHRGFDLTAIRQALAERERGRFRGASTISQQTAKNAFLWPGQDWVRKGLEAGFTVLIEALWGKRRIMEVYLNVAEFGPGIFGAEAAAQAHFGRPASDLTLAQSARLAAVLPNPRAREPNRLGPALQRRARAIAAGAETLRAEGRDLCWR